MPDQATRLRAMMSRRGERSTSITAHRPTVLVCGGNSASGVTTLVARLAATCAPSLAVEIIDGSLLTASEIHRLWQDVNEVVIVTTSDCSAVLDAYAMVKAHALPHEGQRFHVLFSEVETHQPYQPAFARLQRSCQRFLRVEARLLGALPKEAPPSDGRHVDTALTDIAAVIADVLRCSQSAAVA